MQRNYKGSTEEIQQKYKKERIKQGKYMRAKGESAKEIQEK